MHFNLVAGSGPFVRTARDVSGRRLVRPQTLLVILANLDIVPRYIFFHPLTFEFMFGLLIGVGFLGTRSRPTFFAPWDYCFRLPSTWRSVLPPGCPISEISLIPFTC